MIFWPAREMLTFKMHSLALQIITLALLLSNVSNNAPDTDFQSREASQVYCVTDSDLISNAPTVLDFDVQLVPAEKGEKITLQCKRCNNGHTLEQAPDRDGPRIWYERRFAPTFAISPLSEVVLGVAAPLTANRMYTTAAHQLVIQEYLPDVDGDFYECRGLEHSDVFPVKYFVDELKVPTVKLAQISGGWSVFREFEESKLNKLADAIQDLTGSTQPEVLMHWGPWSQCQSCNLGVGKRWRRGRCRISIPREMHILPYNLTTISCRSKLLDLVPLHQDLTQMLVNLPEFVLHDFCQCLGEGAKTLIREESNGEKMQYHVLEGDSIQIICPRTKDNLMQLVEWTKGFEELTVGEWVPLGKKSKARVDVLGSLLIENADREAEGQYVCRSSHKSHHFLVFVQQRSIFKSAEFHESILVVSVALLITFFIYVSYVCMLCFEPAHMRMAHIDEKRSGKKKVIRKISSEELEMQPWFLSGDEAQPVGEEDYDADDDLEEKSDPSCYQYTLKTNVSIKTNQAKV